MICSVCIATYKRPQLLRNLLDSLYAQNLPANVNLQLIVVDNDKDKSAQEIAGEYENINCFTIEYFVQPEKNISSTRNVAVKNSIGEYLLFIDDDEEADKNWIKNYLDALNKYKADGIFGPVLPVFHDKTPMWMKKSNFFNKECPPSGEEAIFTRTSNCIIRSDIIKSVAGPFDSNYGITGGEDTHLFSRLKKKGAKFISCREAVVTEFVIPERTRTRWLFKKSFQTGNTATRRMIENAQKRIKRKLELLLRAITFAVISLILVIIYFPIKEKRVKWLIKLASNIGHIVAVFGFNYKAYK